MCRNELMNQILGTLVMSNACALALWLLVEAPANRLCALALRNNK
ncbi:unnamed protein product [Plutella xylostella]|uniref:(diamondback moth) hypothetical protein n=1 Tax=Plutella xylostella TaxID=51655 RepID=A0A8S4FI06_PLUXY|nr:unnamed protein product [Plutella xylostella]